MRKKMVQLKKFFKKVLSLDAGQARLFMDDRKEGMYTILDVRQPAEYEKEHIPGAKLVPLPDLNNSLDELDPEKPTIVHCAIGGRSRVAAQLLSGFGFNEVYNLTGGIKAWQGNKATGPVELNLDLIRGDETPNEIIKLAYGMEQGLQRFYETMHSRTKDSELADFLWKMVDVEQIHKKTLFDLLAIVDSPEQDLESFEAEVDSDIMEGGFDMTAFMEKNEPFLHTFSDVIDLAMMLETQALDLYLRFAEKSTMTTAKEVLFKIGKEERNHLASLGRLLEEKK
jgi:rhodanese-related sulfurtransferase/rubrerythrin